MKWETMRLGDVCTKIGSGATPKGGATVYVDDGVSLIRSQNVYNLHFSYDGLAHITDEAAEALNGVTIKENDVLINITGDSVARTCIVPSNVLPARVNQHVAIIRPNKAVLNPRFLNYYLVSPYMQSYMLGLAVGKGASRNAMTKDMIAAFQVPCPSLEKQGRIADLLSAYDSLIENNQKQIKLLEEAAQRLYKEWFIDLRFPGHESTPIHDGIPEGWERKSIGDLISYEIGGGWGDEEPSNSADHGAYVIRGTDFYGLTHGSLMEIPFRYHGKNNLAARALQDGDIVFEVSGGSRTEGVARTALIRKDMLARWDNPVMCASFCKLIRPITPEYSQYLFNHFQYLRSSGKTEEYDKRSASSIVNYRWKDFLSQETMLEPSKQIIDLYNQNVAPIYDAIVAKSLQIETARNARNRLLPKLMSGEIEV